MKPVTFTLIVPTRNRVAEVVRLLDSLVLQTYRSFDVIIADQNSDERLVPVVERYANSFTIRRIRCMPNGVAAARNAGLRICRGEIIAFPDDDCWYPPDVLERVLFMLESHPEWAAVSGREAASIEMAANPRFDAAAGPISRQNIWRRHISFTAFMRRSALGELFYDTTLGVGAGTIWGSGEETDFLLRFLEMGNLTQYEPTLIVFHPDWGRGPYTLAAMSKARKYGMGMGRVLQVHRFPLSQVCVTFARPLVGGFYTLILGKPRKALYHWSIFLGRSFGWFISLFLSVFRESREIPKKNDSTVSPI